MGASCQTANRFVDLLTAWVLCPDRRTPSRRITRMIGIGQRCRIVPNFYPTGQSLSRENRFHPQRATTGYPFGAGRLV